MYPIFVGSLSCFSRLFLVSALSYCSRACPVFKDLLSPFPMWESAGSMVQMKRLLT